MSHYHERAWAEANGTDLPNGRAPHIPVCQAEADWIDAERDGEVKRIRAVSRERAAENRAEQRARCTVKWDREFHYLLQSIGRVRALRRHHGFDDPLLDEGRELIQRVFLQITGPVEPDHIGGTEG